MPVVGIRELTARLNALGVLPEAIAKEWGDETLRLARARVRVGATGRTRASIRIDRRSKKGVRFRAGFGAKYLELGTPPHPIPGGKAGHGLQGKAMKFKGAGGRTVFSKKVEHPRTRKRPFMRVSANAALRGLKREIVRLWDEAA